MRREGLTDRGKPRYRMLYTVTGLTLAVFLVFTLATILLLNRSMNRLTRKSQEVLLKSQAETIKSSTDYISYFTGQRAVERLTSISPNETLEGFFQKEVLPVQRELSQELRSMVERGLNGLDAILVVLLVEPFGDRPAENVIYLASDERWIYSAQVPEKIVASIKNGDTYLWLEEGIPELGLTGEHLVVLHPFSPLVPYTRIYIVCSRPMHDEITRMESALEQERTSNMAFLLGFLAMAIAVLAVIVLIVLRRLIISRITRPVERLAGAAAKVMEGDLDVEVEVDEKSEFAVLEEAFKNMVESLRRLIEKSIGGQG